MHADENLPMLSAVPAISPAYSLSTNQSMVQASRGTRLEGRSLRSTTVHLVSNEEEGRKERVNASDACPAKKAR